MRFIIALIILYVALVIWSILFDDDDGTDDFGMDFGA